MARLAIVLLAVFWTIVTVGSLVWEVLDPASISTDQHPAALPAGLTGNASKNGSANGSASSGQPSARSEQPTLAELTPGLRASLREQIGDQTVAVPSPEALVPPAGRAGGDKAAVATGTIGESPETAGPASGEPAVQLGASASQGMMRPRPRPESLPALSAPKGVMVPEARPMVPERGGDSHVAEAQSLLTVLGYRVGAVDGRMGPQTRAAIMAYEKKGGLKVDGVVDDRLLARLRADARSTSREMTPSSKTAVATPSQRSLAGRVLGGAQHLIGHDLNSVTAPDKLAVYCDNRGDEWVYDRGLDRMRSCADIVGNPAVAFRPLPGDR